MGSTENDVRETIARHERELADLRQEIKALQDGYHKERLEAQISRRIAELEAEIQLQELQETIAREEAEKQRKRRLFGRR